MAFISEITYAGYGEAAAGEYVEVTLMPGENPADFTLSFYDADGTLHDGASSFFASGEFTLQDIVDAVGGIPGTLTSSVGGLDLQVAYHPDNPAALVFIIPSTLSAGTTTASAEALALTDTSSDTVLDAYDIGANSNSVMFTEGAATGTTLVPTVDGSGSGNSVQVDYEGNQSSGAVTPGDSVICFHDGTRLQTLAGEKPLETLRPGDILATEAGVYLPLRFIFCRKVDLSDALSNPKLWPVRIAAGALGCGLPRRDLLVSRQHRILVTSRIAERMFGDASVLLAAHFLVGLPGIELVRPERGFCYWHILLDRHAVVFAEGAAAESLFVGQQTLHLIPKHAFASVIQRFPAYLLPQDPDEAAHRIPPRHRQVSLVRRHRNNGLPLVDVGLRADLPPVDASGTPSPPTCQSFQQVG